MGKKYWIKSVIALAGCFAIAGCIKQEDYHQVAIDQFSNYFKTLVIGNTTIDPNQDWNTVSTITVDVSVDLASYAPYTVYIFQTPPLLDADVHYLGMAKLYSGESKTISIAKPANVGLLYAACYDASNHAICKPFVANTSDCKVEFTGSTPSESQSRGTRASTTGNYWSVPVLSMPNLSQYTSGSLTEMTIEENQIAAGDTQEKHLKISDSYKGVINRLNTLSNQSVYVTGTWTLTYDQYVNNGSVIVVGQGGRIIVPRGYKLSTNPYSGTSTNGTIYVMEGGQISGDGTIEITNSQEAPTYNAGTITIKDVLLNSGTFYNAGVIGNENSTNTRVTGESEYSSNLGQFINQGKAFLRQTSGDYLSILNGSYLQVATMSLNQSCRMDDGSYTECTSLILNGDSNSDKVIHMGNGAYLNCTDNISIDNFGVWGPSGSGYKWNAILKVNNCTLCNTTDGQASTYLLDHVELILPSDFPTIFDEGVLRTWDSDIKCYGLGTLDTTFSGYNNILMLYNWMNGYEGAIISPNNYQWALANNEKYNFGWKDSNLESASGIDKSRQTCIYALSPSYNTSGSDFYGYSSSFTKESNTIPECNWIYYAFEINDYNKDYDYNDVVLRIGAPNDNEDGTFTSTVEICAVGTTKYATVLRDGEDFGKEVHIAIGTSTIANVNNYNRLFRELTTLTFNDCHFQLEKQNFTLRVTDEYNVEDQYSQVDHYLNGAPTYLIVSGDANGNWYWPIEKMNIGVVYPQFPTWAGSPTGAAEWYYSNNASSDKRIISY